MFRDAFQWVWCRIFGHGWDFGHKMEDGKYYKCCVLCGKWSKPFDENPRENPRG